MTPEERNRALALAGAYQAISLTRDVAEKGLVEIHDLRHAIEPIFKLDAANVDEIYGGADRLKRGIEAMATLKMPATRPSSVYLAHVLHLEKNLSRTPDLLDRIAAEVQKAQAQADYFGDLVHENVIASLAETYKTTVGALKPRIRVQGDPRHLERPENAAKVRALLLSAIRSAVLWRQEGGRRWQLLLGHGKLIQHANALWSETEGYHPG